MNNDQETRELQTLLVGVRQIRAWMEAEYRLLIHEDVKEDERSRMDERAETLRGVEEYLVDILDDD
jgi:hypothetical protein